MSRHPLLLLPLFVALAALSAASGCNPAAKLRCEGTATEPGTVVINELFYKASTAASATDFEKVNFVELAGPPNRSLNCLDLVGVNGNECTKPGEFTLYNPISLAGKKLGDDGLFLIVEAHREWSWSQDRNCPDGQAGYKDPDTDERICVDDPCDPNPCTEAHKGVCGRNLPEGHTCSCDHGYNELEDGGCVENPIYQLADLVHEHARFQRGPDAVVLVDITGPGTNIDSVTYGGPITCKAVPPLSSNDGPARPPATRESIARCTGLDEADDEFVDTRNNALDFNTASPSPGAPNSKVMCPEPCADPPLPDEVVFTEIAPRTFGSQWVELLNVSDDHPGSLCNCHLALAEDDEGGTLQLKSDSTLAWGPLLDPGERIVLAKSELDEACEDVRVDFFWGSGVNLLVSREQTALLLCEPMAGMPMPNDATIWEIDVDSDTGEGTEVYEVARQVFNAEELARGYSLAQYSDGSWGRSWDDAYCVTEDGPEYGSPRQPNADPPPCPCPGTGDVVLTEVMDEPDGDDAKEWFELYFDGDERSNLYCYSVKSLRWSDELSDWEERRTWSMLELDSPPTVEPDSYLLVRDDDCADFDNCVSFTTVGSGIYSTGPTALDVVCTDDGGVEHLVDRAEYNHPVRDDDNDGYSFQLHADHLDADSNDYWYRWCFADSEYETLTETDNEGIETQVTNYGTPGAANSACPEVPSWPAADSLVISEVLYKERSRNPSWFEVYNPGAGSAPLAGCTLIDYKDDGSIQNQHLFPLDASVSVPAGGYLVIAEDQGDCPNASSCVRFDSLSLYVTSANPKAALAIECPRLDDPSGLLRTEIDQMSYANDNTSVGRAWVLDPSKLTSSANDLATNWYQAADDQLYVTPNGDEYGTPGTLNPPPADK